MLNEPSVSVTGWRDRACCGALRPSDVGRAVRMVGWVDARRDHGDLVFIHLRDWTGIAQIVFQPNNADLLRTASGLHEEFCIQVSGEVVRRVPGTENPSIATGDVEVVAHELTIINPSVPLPFPVSEKAMLAGGGAASPSTVSEDIRLQYRYLDLRRPSMQDNLRRRYRILKAVRDVLDSRGFVEVETPVLTKSTPEGARDYLVPSRLHPGCFYALPQSPQLFKQLLMTSGIERYFQIVKCFRDEDLRPNRQPEFTQLDLEASFIDEEFIYELIEEVLCVMFAVEGIQLPRPFPRMTYDEAVAATGSDRPDLRFGLRLVDATDIFGATRYGIFQEILKRSGSIIGINVKGQSGVLSKNVLQNEYARQIVPEMGGRGMTWMRFTDGRLDSNIVQFFSDTERAAIVERFGCEEGDVLMIIADPSYRVATSVLGQLRLHVAKRLDLIPRGVYCPVWVTDFPLFDPTEEGGVTSTHHPFTSPDRTDFDPGDVNELLTLKSRAYDIVLNGEELGGGSIRINDPAVQNRVFQALGLGGEEVEEKFGFFLKALEFGAPPHGGIALGVDRVVAMIVGANSIRDVIAFPKNRSAFCPLTGAPSPVGRAQLSEVGLLDLTTEKPPPKPEEETLVRFLSWVSRIGIAEGEERRLEEAVAQAERIAGALTHSAKPDEEPLFSVVEAPCRMRPGDRARIHPLAAERELLRRAPAVKGDYFKVASVME